MLQEEQSEELSAPQAQAWANYQRMRVRLSERLSRELARATGLSEADYEILTALAATPNEPVRALALRCGLEWEKSRLSHQLRRMEERGLVLREECIEDNRGSVVRITAQGRQRAAAARATYAQTVRRYVTDVLTPEQMDALGAIAERVLQQLDAPHRA